VQTGVERNVTRVQVTSRHGDFGGDSDNPVSIMWYDVGNTFLGSYVDATMWNGSPDKTTVLSNLGAASYFVLPTSPGFNDTSVFWQAIDAKLSIVPETSSFVLLSASVPALAVASRRRGQRTA